MAIMIAIGSALLALLSSAQAGAIEVELLRNGDFEAAATPTAWRADSWAGEATAVIDADAHTGVRALRMTGPAEGATAVASQSASLLSADAPVTVRGWWRGEVAQGAGGRIVLRWTDAGGEKLRDEPPLTASGSFDWRPFELTATPPEGAARATLFLELWESRGSVWYDDVSLVQSLEPPQPGDFMTGRTPETITVGVFDANAAGGRGFGAQGILDALAGVEGVSAEMIADASLATLGRFDVVVLPNVHIWGAGETADVLQEHPELAWLAGPRASLAAWVRMGGGLILTHQSNGSSPALSPSILPQVTDVLDKTTDTRPTTFADHPVTAGLQPFDPTFTDARILRPGPAAEVLMRNAAGEVLGVAGEVGRGRVVGIGMCPGIDPNEQPVTVSAGEAQLLANAVRWVGADEVAEYALLVAPDTVELTDPEDDIELTLTAIATADHAPATVGAEVGLLQGDFTPAASVPVARVEVPMGGSATVRIEAGDLQDGSYYPALRPEDTARAEAVATVRNHAGFARFADTLPKPEFKWAAMNVHGPGELKTEAEIAEMARAARAMNFDAVLFAAKPPSGLLYYNTQIGEKAPGFEEIDPLALAVKYCHAEGLQLLVQFCTFSEGSAGSPSAFIRAHPEWADWDPGDGPDISRHRNGVFGCPDRPEVRAYELALMREMAENYDIDGFSFDYIRYKNDRWCVCPYSEEHFARWREQHPEVSAAQARARHAEEQIVSFTWEVRRMLDEVKPEAILHGYCHPTWANRFPLNYLSFRASAHWTYPGRGGPWPLEQVFEAAQRNVDLADDHVEFIVAAPMADTGYVPYHKPPERFRRELRLIGHAGAPAVMIYLYSTLRQSPELRQVIAEELAK